VCDRWPISNSRDFPRGDASLIIGRIENRPGVEVRAILLPKKTPLSRDRGRTNLRWRRAKRMDVEAA